MSIDIGSDELEFAAQTIQKECHETVETIMQTKDWKSGIQYQDAINCFFFRKLAEYQLQINRLSSQITEDK